MTPEDNRRTGLVGQVKWFDARKGYGFIRGPEGQDVFVHFSQIRAEGYRTLKEGTLVEYEASRSDRGWSAYNVVPRRSAGVTSNHVQP